MYLLSRGLAMGGLDRQALDLKSCRRTADPQHRSPRRQQTAAFQASVVRRYIYLSCPRAITPRHGHPRKERTGRWSISKDTRSQRGSNYSGEAAVDQADAVVAYQDQYSYMVHVGEGRLFEAQFLGVVSV